MSKILRFMAALAIFLGFEPLLWADTTQHLTRETHILFAAYVGVWLVTLFLVIRIGMKAAHTAREILQLQQEVQDLQKRLDKKV